MKMPLELSLMLKLGSQAYFMRNFKSDTMSIPFITKATIIRCEQRDDCP